MNALKAILLTLFFGLMAGNTLAATVTHSGNISADETWSALDVHHVTANLVVDAGVTLTIEPGAVIKVASGRYIIANGIINAAGTEANPIVFTSDRDDTIGGDTNGDGDNSIPARGNWSYMRLNDAATVFDYVTVRYSGGGGSSLNLYNGITINHVTVSEGNSHGIYVNSSASASINNCLVDGHRNQGIYLHVGDHSVSGTTVRNAEQNGLYIDRGTHTITNNVFENNTENGVWVYSGRSAVVAFDGNTMRDNDRQGVGYSGATDSTVFTNNTITGNNVAVTLPFSQVPNPEDGNSINGNTLDTIRFYGNTRSSDLRMAPGHVALYIMLGGTVTVPIGQRITIDPGTVLKMDSGANWNIDGILRAVGSVEQPIQITSAKDDTIAGDTNLDGGNTTPSSGDWYRIYYRSDADGSAGASEMAFVNFAYGGSSSQTLAVNAAVPLSDLNIRESRYTGLHLGATSDNTVTRVSVENCGDHGLYIGNGGTYTISDSSFNNNTGQGIYLNRGNLVLNGSQANGNLENGIFVYYGYASILSLDNNTVTNNAKWGIYFSGPTNSPVMTNNTVTGNQRPMCVPYSMMPNTTDGNDLSNNTYQAIAFRGNNRSENLRLSPAIAVYWFTNGESRNLSDSALTVDPGSILKFDSGSSLRVDGPFSCVGTELSPITMTSVHDDSVGGDTRLDGSDTLPARGDWQRLYVYSSVPTDAGQSAMAWTNLKWSGNAGQAIYLAAPVPMDHINISESRYNGIDIQTTGDVNLTNSSLTALGRHGVFVGNGGNHLFDNILIDGAVEQGFYLNRGNTTVRNSISRNNGGHGLFAYYGYSSVHTIEGNSFLDNANYGIYFDRATNSPPISGNTISGNYRAYSLPFSAMPSLGDDNTITGNDNNVVVMRGNYRDTDLTLDPSFLYYGTEECRLLDGAAWNIPAGTIIKGNTGSYFRIDGIIRSQGTESEPVIFTSYRDDSRGGDTNNDADATAPAQSDWYYLNITNTAGIADGESRLDHTQFYFGGRSNATLLDAAGVSMSHIVIEDSRYDGLEINHANPVTLDHFQIRRCTDISLRINNGQITLTNSTIEDNSRYGVYIHQGNHVLENNLIQNNADHGVRVNESPAPTVSFVNNQILNNATYGIYFDGAVSDASFNGNTISGNFRALRIPFNGIPNADQGNILTGNTEDVLSFFGNNRSTNLTVGPELGVLYQISGLAQMLEGTTLDINAGTIWKMGTSCELRAQGIMRMNGSAANPITFTSFRDDSIGGDTNGDADATAPAVGNWHSLTWRATSPVAPGESEMAYTHVRWGGNNGYLVNLEAAVPVNNSHISNSRYEGLRLNNASDTNATLLENNTIENNGTNGLLSYRNDHVLRGNTVTNNNGYGIFLDNGNATVENNLIQDNASDGINISTGSNPQPIIDGNNILNNEGYGIYYRGASTGGPITNNTITGNNRIARVGFSAVPQQSDGNSFSDNDKDVIHILANTRDTDLILTPDVASYQFDSSTYTLADNTLLQLDPGTLVKMGNNTYLDIRGTIRALGTETDKIVFTSYRDDSYGGDWDGTAIPPGPGDWRTLRINNPDAPLNDSSLDHVILRYAGQSSNHALDIYRTGVSVANTEVSYSRYTGLLNNGGTLTADNLLIHSNNFYGMYLYDTSNSTVTNSKIFGNQNYGVYLTHTSNATFSDSEFFANEPYAIYNSGSGTVTADGNWWGDPLGAATRAPAPVSGTKVLHSGMAANTIQTYTYNVVDDFGINPGESLIVNVYLDPQYPPREIMFQWRTDNSWDHRAYWGENLIDWGTNGTESRLRMGDLPATGQWVRLEVPAAAVGVENNLLDGMAFSMHGGNGAIVSYDAAGKTDGETDTIWIDDAFPENAAISGSWAFIDSTTSSNGDATFGNVTTANPLTDGTPYYFFDAGGDGSRDRGYQLQAPVVIGGTASTDDGFTVSTSQLYNNTTKQLDVAFSALPTMPLGYRVFSTYMNNDAVSGSQRMLDGDGGEIHPLIPISIGLPIPRGDRIDGKEAGGDLSLILSAEEGDRVVLNSMLLMEDVLSSSGAEIPPNPPVVSNYTTVASPDDTTTTQITTDTVTLNGTRDADSSVWIDGIQVVAPGSDPWSYEFTPKQGDNQLTIFGRGANGLTSASIYLNLDVDSIAPEVLSIYPTDGTATAEAPDNIVLQVREDTSGIDTDATSLVLQRNGVDVPGNWSLEEANLPDPRLFFSLDSLDTSGNVLREGASGLIGTIEGEVLSDRPGVIGESLGFRGGYAQIPDGPETSITGENITVAAWVRPQQFNAWSRIAVKQIENNPRPYMSYGLLFYSTTGRPTLNLSTTNGDLVNTPVAPSPLPVDEWSHVAFTYNGSIARLFVNGVQVITRNHTGSIIDTTAPFCIGGNSEISVDRTIGDIDEVAVWDQTLSPGEIASVYHNGLAKLSLQPVQSKVTGQGDQYIFTPDSPFVSGDYHLEATLVDQHGNSDDLVTADYIMELEVPNAPVVSSHSYGPDPSALTPIVVSEASATITGTRDANTSLWVDGRQIAGVGNDPWSVQVGISQGDTLVEVYSINRVGTVSPSSFVRFHRDTLPPRIAAVNPPDGAIRATQPDIYLQVADGAGGIDLGNSILSLTSGGNAVPGTWSQSLSTPPVPSLYWSLSEADSDGNTIYERIQGLEGTFQGNGVVAVPGRVGEGIRVDNSGLVRVEHSAPVDYTGQVLTLSVWLKPYSHQSWPRILAKQVRNNARPYMCYGLYMSPEGYPRFQITTDADPGNGTTVGAQNQTSLALNEWHHIAGVYNGETMRFYIDGVMVGEALKTGNIISSTGAFYIGGNGEIGSGDRFDGQVDEAGVWFNALSDAEVASIYHQGVIGRELPTSLGKMAEGDRLHFTPDADLIEGSYQIDATVTDFAGLSSAPFTSSFTMDFSAPVPPTVDPVTSPTPVVVQTLSGGKEAGTGVVINGQLVTAIDESTTWSYQVSLVDGINTFNLWSQDAAGNTSESIQVIIELDNQAPGPVTFVANGEGDGTTITLDWSGYDEAANGADIESYQIWTATAAFSDTANAGIAASQAGGSFTATLEGLTRDQTQHIAIVAVDFSGNALTTVTSVAVTPTDVIAPATVQNLRATATLDSITFLWDAPADSDLDGYTVLHPSGTETLPAGTASYTINGLANGTAQSVTVNAFDSSGNGGPTSNLTSMSLLPNPATVDATADIEAVSLTWSASPAPAGSLRHYRVYTATSPISDVSALNPSLISNSTSATVLGLANGVTYYFAVTAVNTYNQELKTVSSVSATPESDNQGPEVTNITWNGQPFADGIVLEDTGILALQATDRAGMQRVAISIDGNIVASRTGAGPNYSYTLVVQPYSDGAHTLTVTAYDARSNTTVVNRSFNISLAAPGVPTISTPANNKVFNDPNQLVTGNADPFSEVVAYINGNPQPTVSTVNSSGRFSVPVTLVEGSNTIQVSARNRGGESDLSAARTVTLDSSVPQAPNGVDIAAREGGELRLTWRTGDDPASLRGYNLYRHNAPFDTTSQATRIRQNYSSTTINDLTPEDRIWYYRISAVNNAGTEGPLSALVNATSDRLPPRALSITYTPQGHYDSSNERFGTGQVDLVIEVSEPLLVAPFLSITLASGLPLPATITKADDTTYLGSFTLPERSGAGVAIAVFSARDEVGNRGTEVDSGASILVDVKAPLVNGIVLSPEQPLNNDNANPLEVTATFSLDEALPAGGVPELAYELSESGSAPIELDPVQINDTTWEATFTLPASAGTPAESLSFSYSGQDDLNNIETRITAENHFQVYEGQLPPLATPIGISAKAAPAGAIEVSWAPVPNATVYELYRRAPGEGSFSQLARVIDATQFTDTPASDGLYSYAVASIRQANGQESESALSSSASATSDRIAPDAPRDLSLVLAGNGIFAQWNQSVSSPAEGFNLYRANADEITDVSGLTPIIDNIPQQQVVDPYPSETDHAYVVTALDEAGNESLPSNSFYLNFELLPVSSLNLQKLEGGQPQLSWSHSAAALSGFRIFTGTESNRQALLGGAIVSQTNLDDSSYIQGERLYTVIAVDNQGVESPGRSILLPNLSFAPVTGSVLKRNVMNQVDIQVTNHGPSNLDRLQLLLRVQGRDHISESFSMTGNSTTTVPVIVGGYPDLPTEASAELRLTRVPAVGESVSFSRNTSFAVQDDLLPITVSAVDFSRGGTGMASFEINNSSAVEIEVVTASGQGNADSPEVRFRLLDQDDNILSVGSFRQAFGDKVVTLPNGRSVVRIAPGETFLSQATELNVPGDAPDQIYVQVIVDKLHYHLGWEDHVELPARQSRKLIDVSELPYKARITSISPQISTGTEDVIIIGEAIDSADRPLPNVPVKLSVSTSGFARTYDLYTDDNGVFNYPFEPLSNEGGIYNVWAGHPQLVDGGVQDSFTIQRIKLGFTAANLTLPRNYSQQIKVPVQGFAGTEASNLRFVYDAADQPTGETLDGFQMNLPAIASFAGNKKGQVLIDLAANNNAPGSGTLVFRLVSDGHSDWGRVSVNFTLTEARPSLHYAPSYIETGVALQDTITEVVTLSNKGLADMRNISFALVDTDGNPAPSWVVRGGPQTIDRLSLDQTVEIPITFAPTATVDPNRPGPYEFVLRIITDEGTNEVPLYCFVNQSGVGSVLFKITDIYTATLDDNGNPIEGMKDARIRLTKETGETLTYNQTTDATGESFFEDIPAGRYHVKISGPSHNSYSGRIWIKPGVTLSETVHLDYELVTVEWSVTPTTIEDRYEIVLEATFETHVPAPVVILEPNTVNLPETMRAGDVIQGEMFLTNYGLIRADDIAPQIPSGPNYKFEWLVEPPESLLPGESLRLPYRVTALTDFNDEESGGAGCSVGVSCGAFVYFYRCSNGQTGAGLAAYCIVTVTSTGGGCGPTGGGDGPVFNFGPGGDGPGRSWNWVGPNLSGGGVTCDVNPCSLSDLSCILSGGQSTGSAVDLLSGKFSDDVVDMELNTRGGPYRLTRYYTQDAWKFGHDLLNLSFSYDGTGAIRNITTERVDYGKADANGTVFTYGKRRTIRRTEDGFTWTNRDGQWRIYDEQGRLLRLGERDGNYIEFIWFSGSEGRLSQVRDREGEVIVTFDYDNNQRLETVTDLLDRTVHYGYDTHNRLTSVTDPRGLVTTYTYDNYDRLKSKTKPSGRETHITYNNEGTVTATTDALGRTMYFSYNYQTSPEEEYYASVQFPDGNLKEVWYNRDGSIKRVAMNGEEASTEPLSNASYEYDDWNNLTRVLTSDGGHQSYEYDPATNLLTQSNSGIKVEYTYDELGNLIHTVESPGSDHEVNTSFTYDGNGNRLTKTREATDDLPAATWTYTYDAYDNLDTTTDPLGNVTDFDYDAIGRLLKLTDANEAEWTYTYDAVGNLLTETNPLNQTTTYTYDADNQVETVTDALGRVTTFEHDFEGRITKRTLANGDVYDYAYDLVGNLVTITDAENRQINFTYDAMGNMLTQTDGEGNLTSYEYDDPRYDYETGEYSSRLRRIITNSHTQYINYGANNLVQSTQFDDGQGNTPRWVFNYNTRGQISERRDPDRVVTKYIYDGYGNVVFVADGRLDQNGYDVSRIFRYDVDQNLIEKEDAEGHKTTYGYDALGRRTSRSLPEGETFSYTYTKLGKVEDINQPNGTRLHHDYDAAGRLVAKLSFANQTDTEPSSTTTYGYDAVGNMTSYANEFMSATLTYDELGRKLSETLDYGDFEVGYSYTYDGSGNRVSFTAPDGTLYNYDFDNAQQLTGIDIPEEGALTYSEHNNGIPTRIELPGGATETRELDPLLGIKKILLENTSGVPVLDLNYTRTAAGRVDTLTDDRGTTEYDYDALGQLLSVEDPVTGTVIYVYDFAGNRLRPYQTNQAATFNENNQLLEADGVTYTYDPNGQTLTITNGPHTTRFFYNEENKLIRAEDQDGAVLAAYRYDPMGRRIMKKIGLETVFYVYSDEGLIGEFLANGTQLRSYGYKPGGSHNQQPVFMREGEDYFYYSNDHMGTPQRLTDGDGDVFWSAHTDHHGETTIDPSSSVTNNLRFEGQYFDAETGLHYNYARNYDTSTGRYLEFDPLLDEVNAPIYTEVLDENAYAYVGNQLVNRNDPPGTSVGVPVCSGIPVCSAQVVGACSAQVTSGVCSGQGAGVCSGQGSLTPGAVGCSGQVVGACSGQAGPVGAAGCSGQVVGVCSGQLGGQGSACSGTLVGACSGQGGAGPGVAVCSGMLAGACSAQGGVVDLGLSGSACSGVLVGSCSAQGGLASSGGSACSGVVIGSCSGNGGAGCSAVVYGSCGGDPVVCFTAETLISTVDGLVRIDQIQAGDQVYSANEGNGDVELKSVVAVTSRQSASLILVNTADGKTIRTTSEHPFWVLGQGWTPAHHLHQGQFLLDANGQALGIFSIETAEGETVYNFEVADNHNYFVGEREVLVHNRCDFRLRK